MADQGALWDTLYTSCMSGQRLYYPHPTIFTDTNNGIPTATVFKIKQLVPYALMREVIDAGDDTDKSADMSPFSQRDNPAHQHLSNHMSDFCTMLNQQSYTNRQRPLSVNILNNWLTSPFDQWLEGFCEQHWFQAEWFQQKGAHSWDDYAILIKVNTPIPGSVQDFEEGYGQAFVMTKMMYDIT
jgi:hypothetical protein